jgi:putative ABC transport system permease protein
MLWESFKLALRTIRRNVLRSFLTLLGIVIGVGAVIALVTLGQGTNDKVKADLSKLGSNMLIARPGSSQPGPPSGNESRSFTVRDVEALKAGLRNVRGVAPTSNKQTKVVYGTASLDVTTTGTDVDYFTVQDWTFLTGNAFSESDARSGTNVCVVGATLVRDLFAGVEPLGETIRVASMPCTVIGTLAAKGQSAFGSDQDNTVVMPLRTYMRRIAGNTKISSISVSANSAEVLPAVQVTMTDILRETRRVAENAEDDFSVRDLTQIASTMASTTSLMTGLLGAVAAVSLLVGGIGIMNIMLVSVAERTREIGIRLAIGALASQVLTQFLVEAVVLCLLGGLIGIALGLGLAWGGSSLLQVPFNVNPSVVAMAFGFSGLIGLIFGFFPARRAAQLDPIEALRHE